jgi:hypothetical protein|tara:strand:+ start:1251 stop:2156 length:906 start_codon:yes stop_codon:yes gene_type:complete
MENWGLRQEITLATSKSYKVTFTAKQLTGVGEMYSGLGFTSVPFFNQVITSSFVTYTYYQSPTDVTAPYDTVYFGGKLATGAEVENTFEIKDVTTQEVGQDWNFETGWSIGEDKVIKTGSVASNFFQYNVFTSGKSYKLSFDVSNSNNGRLLVYMGGNSVTEDITNASNVNYTFYGVADGSHIVFRNVNFTGSITNVSVEEVGELKVDIGGAPVQSITTSGTHSLTFTAVDSDPFRIYGSTFTGSVTNIFVTQVAGDTLERWWRVNGNIATLTDPAPNVASNGIVNDITWNNNPPVQPDTP